MFVFGTKNVPGIDDHGSEGQGDLSDVRIGHFRSLAMMRFVHNTCPPAHSMQP
jgi:hypothetical protein